MLRKRSREQSSEFNEYGDLFKDENDQTSSNNVGQAISKQPKLQESHSIFRLQTAISELDAEVEARCREMHEITTTNCQALYAKMRIDLDRIPPSIRQMKMADFVKRFAPEDHCQPLGNAAKAQKELEAWVASTPSVAKKQGKIGTSKRAPKEAPDSVRRSTRKRNPPAASAVSTYQTPRTRYNTRRAGAGVSQTTDDDNDISVEASIQDVKKSISVLATATKGKAQQSKAARAKQTAELAKLRAQLESLASELANDENDESD
jgi:hypothetical protein